MMRVGRALAMACFVCLVADGLRGEAGTKALFEDLGPVRPLSTSIFYRGYTGSIVALKDGSLLWALPVLRDAPPSGVVSGQVLSFGIEGRISTDGGRTWRKPFSIQPAIPGVNEVICPTLRRLSNGELLFTYTLIIHGELTYTHTYACHSSDEGKTWSHPLCATPYSGAMGLTQPDKTIQLSGGRLIIPVEGVGPKGYMISFCYYSDDNGHAWYPSKKPADAGFCTDEASVVELKDGRLLMVFRTDRGYLGKAFSKDRGEMWTDEQLTKLPSPCAPEFITRMPNTGDLLLFWCNNPLAPDGVKGGEQPTVEVAKYKGVRLCDVRSPLSSAVSHDEGETWEHIRDIATNPAKNIYADYGYPGVTFIDDGKIALVHFNATNGIRLVRIGIDWFYGK